MRYRTGLRELALAGFGALALGTTVVLPAVAADRVVVLEHWTNFR